MSLSRRTGAIKGWTERRARQRKRQAHLVSALKSARRFIAAERREWKDVNVGSGPMDDKMREYGRKTFDDLLDKIDQALWSLGVH